MKVTVNGRVVETGSTNLWGLVLSLDLKAEDVVIVRNEIVVKRDVWSSTSLAEGDRLELVSLMHLE